MRIGTISFVLYIHGMIAIYCRCCNIGRNIIIQDIIVQFTIMFIKTFICLYFFG